MAIISKANTPAYRDNYDDIFGKPKVEAEPKVANIYVRKLEDETPEGHRWEATVPGHAEYRATDFEPAYAYESVLTMLEDAGLA